MHQTTRSAAKAALAFAVIAFNLPMLALGPAGEPPARRFEPAAASQFGELSVLRPSRDSIMGFQQPTKIAEIATRGGQEVKRGQLLVRGDDEEEVQMERMQKVRAESTAPVEGARAEMAQFEHEAEMQRQALKNGGSSPPEVKRAELQATVKRYAFENTVLTQTQEVMQYERMKTRVSKFRIEAPFDGIVDVVMGDVGQAVAENEKIVRVVNIDLLWIDVGAKMSDPRTLTLKEGDAAWALLDMAGTPVLRRGKVIEAAPTADMGSRSRRIRVEIANPKGPERVIAGGPAWVRFTEPDAELLRSVGNPAVSTAEATGTSNTLGAAPGGGN